MKSFEQLAQAAYEAHRKEFAKQRGMIPPPWERLEAEWHACWIAAVKQVVAEVSAIH